MSPLKKGELLEKETVETVGSFGMCFIIPQLKLGVNSKLRRHRTVFLIEMPLANSFHDHQMDSTSDAFFSGLSYEIFSNYTNHGHLGGFYNE